MTDHIVLQGISARGTHGVLDFEKAQGQVFVADVALDVDLRPAAASDELARTVNYAELAQEVVEVLEGESLDLIESVAGRIADAALRHRLVEAVEVTVHKPEAPVGVPFTDVRVTVRRERDVPVVIALGANLGDARATLERAVGQLDGTDGLRVDRVSALFETDPVGGPEQPVYLNAVAVARTRLTPESLLERLHAIESRHGRVRETRWGARTLDLDLVQYGDPDDSSDVVADSPELTLPHPCAHERGFVLAPWAALDPGARLRVDGSVRAVSELAAQVDTSGVRPGPDWRPVP